MKAASSWASVPCLGLAGWIGGTLLKHWWQHEAWGHAMLAGVPFGMLALGAAASTARAHTIRARRHSPDQDSRRRS